MNDEGISDSILDIVTLRTYVGGEELFAGQLDSV